MTSFHHRKFRIAGLLAIVAGTATIWIGSPLGAQPQSGSENMREQMFALRSAALGDGVPDTKLESSLSTTVWGINGDEFTPADYDGDGKNDHAIWRPGAAGVAQFKILRSSDGVPVDIIIGQAGDDPSVAGDYDGDGKADAAVYRAGVSAGLFSSWVYHPSGGGADVTVTCNAGLDCGKNGDFPAPGDYNGDGKFDFVVQRSHTGSACLVDNNQGTAPFTPNADFLVTLNGGTTTTFPCIGLKTNVIVPGDYDGDGKTDITTAHGVLNQIQWSVRSSITGTFTFLDFGSAATDFLTQADYDGDGKTDFAVWRPSGTPGASAFFIQPSAGGPNIQFPHGQNGDYPVANWNSH